MINYGGEKNDHILFGSYHMDPREVDCCLFLSTKTIYGTHRDIIDDTSWYGRFLKKYTLDWG